VVEFRDEKAERATHFLRVNDSCGVGEKGRSGCREGRKEQSKLEDQLRRGNNTTSAPRSGGEFSQSREKSMIEKKKRNLGRLIGEERGRDWTDTPHELVPLLYRVVRGTIG